VTISPTQASSGPTSPLPEPQTTRRLGVVTVVDTLAAAGAEILAVRIALGLDPRRFDSVICSTRRSLPDAVEAVREAGIEVLELDRVSKLQVWRWLPLLRLLRSGRIDVVHAHKFGSNLWLALLSPLGTVPVLVAHEHSWSFAGRPLRRLADRLLIARAATKIVAVSPADRMRMIELEGIPPDKVVFIPNGIPDTVPGNRERVRRALRVGPAETVVGTVCGLRREKDLPTALRALGRVSAHRPEVRFVVVGDGPERAPLERLADDLGVRAIFVGHRPNTQVPGLLAAMDVVVLSSRFEGMPLAVLEWMAAGKAIVASRVGGIPSILADGKEALLVTPGDEAAFAAAIDRLLGDPLERHRLGAAAQRRQRRDFRFEKTLAAIEDLYERLVASARARPTGR
jgi:glycosyltransferase involved in cell wall biosynthesis